MEKNQANDKDIVELDEKQLEDVSGGALVYSTAISKLPALSLRSGFLRLTPGVIVGSIPV